jgi:hypothetical protein
MLAPPQQGHDGMIGRMPVAANAISRISAPADDYAEVVMWASPALADMGEPAVGELASRLAGATALDRAVFFGDALNKIGARSARDAFGGAIEAMPQALAPDLRTVLEQIEARRYADI